MTKRIEIRKGGIREDKKKILNLITATILKAIFPNLLQYA